MGLRQLKGFAFPMRFGPLGHFERASGIDKIKANMAHIVKSAIGERNMSFNCGILGDQVLFRNLTTTTFVILRDIIREALAMHEPRVNVRNIFIETEDKKGTLKANILFSVIGSGAFDDLTLILREETA